VRWQRGRREDPELGITPLIDVVFLLLIFFMISTTFKDDSEITIDLPQASSVPAKEDRPPLTVTIDAQGHYFVNDRRLVNDTADTLRKAFARYTTQQERTPSGVVIRADGQAPHQSVVTVMDVARRAGIVHVSLATRPPEKRIE